MVPFSFLLSSFLRTTATCANVGCLIQTTSFCQWGHIHFIIWHQLVWGKNEVRAGVWNYSHTPIKANILQNLNALVVFNTKQKLLTAVCALVETSLETLFLVGEAERSIECYFQWFWHKLLKLCIRSENYNKSEMIQMIELWPTLVLINLTMSSLLCANCNRHDEHADLKKIQEVKVSSRSINHRSWNCNRVRLVVGCTLCWRPCRWASVDFIYILSRTYHLPPPPPHPQMDNWQLVRCCKICTPRGRWRQTFDPDCRLPCHQFLGKKNTRVILQRPPLTRNAEGTANRMRALHLTQRAHPPLFRLDLGVSCDWSKCSRYQVILRVAVLHPCKHRTPVERVTLVNDIQIATGVKCASSQGSLFVFSIPSCWPSAIAL